MLDKGSAALANTLDWIIWDWLDFGIALKLSVPAELRAKTVEQLSPFSSAQVGIRRRREDRRRNSSINSPYGSKRERPGFSVTPFRISRTCFPPAPYERTESIWARTDAGHRLEKVWTNTWTSIGHMLDRESISSSARS